MSFECVIDSWMFNLKQILMKKSKFQVNLKQILMKKSKFQVKINSWIFGFD